MKKLHASIQQGFVALLVCSTMFLTGCGVKVMPKSVPAIRDVETPPMNGVSLIVVNGEKDSSNFPILNDKGQNLGFVANKQAWTKELVESLAGELAKRGAHIRANASLTLSITLPAIIFNQVRDTYQFKVQVAVTSSTGWSNKYSGVAESALGFFESTDALANRLAGRALADAVKAMLNDADFLAQVSGKK
jgi:uncharacterized lipoprotein YajG